MILASASAILLVAAIPDACAQSANLDDNQLQNPLLSQDDLGLRGTEAPLAQSQGLDGQTSPAPSGAMGTDATGNAAGTFAGPPSAADNNNANTINYGRRRSKKPVLYQLRRVPPPKQPIGYPPLPPLTTYRTAPGRIRKGGAPPPSDEPPPPPPPTMAVIPMLPRPIPPKRETAPYDPVGIDIGSLRLFPYAEADTGYESNPNQFAMDVVGSSYVHGEMSGRLQSQWSQNSLSANLRAGYYDFFQLPIANRPDAAATVNGRIDVMRDTKINLESRFTLTTIQPGSPLLGVPGFVFITNRPLAATLGQTVGLNQRFNRLTLDLRGSLDRYMFGNATQSDGTELLLSRSNYNDYAVTGRASWELNPGLVPFVEVVGDARRYDNYYDVYGIARNSNGIAARAGSKIDFTQVLSGEVSAGYAYRDYYASPRLPLLATPTIDGNLVYKVTPLTTLTLGAATTLSETTLTSAAGAATHRFTAQISHALLRNLTLNANASYQVNQYQGTSILEHFWSAGAGLDYNVTRDIVLRGSYTHSRLTSNFLGDYFTDDVFLVGLKLQR